MLDICLLGTGGMMPLPYRWLTSMIARYNGTSLLIDCGEGTQIALRNSGLSAKPIDIICFTHYHADHISGLPGLLLTMGNAERTEPLLMVGPKGLERVVNSLRVIAPELPFEIEYHEITEDIEKISFKGYEITAFKVHHKITCYGYTVEIPRQGKFSVESAKEHNIPMKFWNPLQKGQIVVDGDMTYTPDMVLGAARSGIKVVYCTDTRPVPEIARQAKGADLLICEGMYGEKDKYEKARGYKHMMMQEACEIAKEAEPAELWLTHYSPSLNHPEDFAHELKAIFPRTIIPKDCRMKELMFKDE